MLRQWATRSFLLERIRAMPHCGEASQTPAWRLPGTVEAHSHIKVAEGVDVVIGLGRAGLVPAAVPEKAQYEDMKDG